MYVYLSFVDWCIHKHVLHCDDNVSDWRREQRIVHKQHHLEHHNQAEKDEEGVTFTILETTTIALISVAPILFIGLYFDTQTMILCYTLHILFVFIGVGVHNYVHPLYHNYEDIQSPVSIIWVPDYVKKILNDHHEKHHMNSRTNYCTVFLGFDYIAGTIA